MAYPQGSGSMPSTCILRNNSTASSTRLISCVVSNDHRRLVHNTFCCGVASNMSRAWTKSMAIRCGVYHLTAHARAWTKTLAVGEVSKPHKKARTKNTSEIIVSFLCASRCSRRGSILSVGCPSDGKHFCKITWLNYVWELLSRII